MIEIAELVLRAEAMGVRVEWGRDLPVPAEYDHARRVIRMADGRGDCVTRCSLAHELGHAALMHEPGGDYIAQDARWPTIRKTATDFGDKITAAGGSVDVVNLPAVGITGNSHMLMMDKNNLAVAQLIQDWLAKKGLTK